MHFAPVVTGRFSLTFAFIRARNSLSIRKTCTHVIGMSLFVIDKSREMFQSQPKRCLQGFAMNVFLVSALILLTSESVSRADEVPAFFLKIAKNIPRVGRSGNVRDYLTNHPEELPRVAGVTENESSEEFTSHGNGSPFMGPIKRRLDFKPINAADAWAWQHFPLAIEGPRELWRTLAGYSTDTSDDLDNEIWERQKRTGSMPSNSQM